MIQAAKALSTKPSVAGQAYFITNDDAQPFWRFLGDFLEPLGYGRPRIKLPFYPILMLAIIFEYLVRYHHDIFLLKNCETKFISPPKKSKFRQCSNYYKVYGVMILPGLLATDYAAL